MTDIILFVVILVGLRRLRGESGGSFDPGSLPWKQVGLRRFLFVVPQSTNDLLIWTCKGIVWLIIAAAAEVPPTVNLASSHGTSFFC